MHFSSDQTTNLVKFHTVQDFKLERIEVSFDGSIL